MTKNLSNNFSGHKIKDKEYKLHIKAFLIIIWLFLAKRR